MSSYQTNQRLAKMPNLRSETLRLKEMQKYLDRYLLFCFSEISITVAAPSIRKDKKEMGFKYEKQQLCTYRGVASFSTSYRPG